MSELAALVYLGAIVTVWGFVLWYASIGLLGVERAGLFSGVLPISALACAAAIGAGQVSPEQLAAVGVVVLGITLGMRVAPRETAQGMRVGPGETAQAERLARAPA